VSSKPFSGASILRILLLSICWTVLTVVLYFTTDIEGVNKAPFFINLAFIGLLSVIFIELKLKGIKFYHYLTPNKKSEWQLLYIFIPLIIISLGFGWLVNIILYYISPEYFQSRYLSMVNSSSFDPQGSFGSILMVSISACVVAPLAEELLFRGIFFDKLRNRWSVLIGLIVSSFIFGVFHFDIIGSFLFGVVLCILYLETESLFVPIGIHFLNNSTAVLLSLIWPKVGTSSSGLNYLFENLWLYISFLIIGASWLVWFIYSRRNLLTKEMKSRA